MTPSPESGVYHHSRRNRSEQFHRFVGHHRPVVLPVLGHGQPPGRWHQKEAGGVRGLPFGNRGAGDDPGLRAVHLLTALWLIAFAGDFLRQFDTGKLEVPGKPFWIPDLGVFVGAGNHHL